MRKEIMRNDELKNEALASRWGYMDGCIDILASLVGNVLFEYDAMVDTIRFSRAIQIGMSLEKIFQGCLKPGALVRLIHPEDIPKVIRILRSQEDGEVEFRWLQKDGYIWYGAMLKRIPYTKDGHVILMGSITNIEQQKKEVHNKKCQEIMDALTQIYNKDCLNSKIDQFLEEEGADGLHAVMLININDFNTVNHKFGYQFGDMVLTHVAEQLKDIFSNEEIIGRVGGDKFLVFLPKCSDRTWLFEAAQRVSKVMEDIYVGGSRDYEMTCSIGVASYPRDGKDYGELFRHADTAVYVAGKKKYGNLMLYENCGLHLTEEKEFYYRYRVEDMGAYGRTEFDKEITTFAVDVMSRMKDVNSAIVLLLNYAKKLLGVDCVRIYEASFEQNRLSVNYTSGTQQNIRQIKNVFYEEAGLREYISLFKNGFFSAADTSKIRLLTIKHAFYEQGIQSVLQCALYGEEQFLGCVSLEANEKKRNWTQYELSCLYTITTIISSYLLKIRASEQSMRDLQYINSHDQLTNLPTNSNFIKLVMRRMIAEPAQRYAVISTDIISFKYINDTFGYEVGNQILYDYGSMLSQHNRMAIESARDHADKFLFLVHWDYAEKIKDSINEMNEAFAVSQKRRLLGWKLSIVAGVCPIDSINGIETAIENANIARKSINRVQKTECQIYNYSMQEQLKHEIEIISEQEKALLNREFEIYLQPKIGLKENRLVGAEALVRWRKEDGAMLYPDQFIPIFEKNGFIINLDYYVYEVVCKILDRWLKVRNLAIPISVNVSRIHLNDEDFVPRFESLVDQYKVPSNMMELELTETCVLNDLDNAVRIMKSLQEKGFVVSIDDFGAGYSSLNLLKDIKTDVLKLDKEFLRQGLLKKEDKIIVSSIISMAKQLDMKVLSEGVETKLQSEFLRESACDMAQGYLYARPMPISEFERILFSKGGRWVL